MAGMKEGPGSDPFADDESEDETDPSDSESAERTTTAGSEQAGSANAETTDTGGSMRTDQIPYVVRRQTVKEDRNNEHVAFLRDDYAALEGEILDDVAAELEMRSKDVSVTDLREALVELGSRHRAELADILDEWGYEHLK